MSTRPSRWETVHRGLSIRYQTRSFLSDSSSVSRKRSQNSLHMLRPFPVRWISLPCSGWEFPCFELQGIHGQSIEFPSQRRGQNRGSWSPAPKFPCIFPRNRERQGGDRFADDCLHRQVALILNGCMVLGFMYPQRQPQRTHRLPFGLGIMLPFSPIILNCRKAPPAGAMRPT
jgi:hypothetical protein